MLKIKKQNLILFTGFIWLWASFALLHRAYTWIDILTNTQLQISALLAVIIAVGKTYLIFRKLTLINIARINAMKTEYISILKFHVLKDQLLIVVMIVAGSVLRHSAFIQKSWLMPVYLGIGLAMLYSASLYFIRFFKTILR